MVETNVATIAGGCFWCMEAIFEKVYGVESVVSGYTGGHTEDPSYHEVCSGSTGHAEALQIKFETARLDYETILEIFFAYHDPTTLNRQGNDVGTQYRSAIFCHDDAQKSIAQNFILGMEKASVFLDPIVTEVTEIGQFYKAESYHQSYFQNNPNQPYCQAIILPKIIAFREKHASLLKPDTQRN